MLKTTPIPVLEFVRPNGAHKPRHVEVPDPPLAHVGEVHRAIVAAGLRLTLERLQERGGCWHLCLDDPPRGDYRSALVHDEDLPVVVMSMILSFRLDDYEGWAYAHDLSTPASEAR